MPVQLFIHFPSVSPWELFPGLSLAISSSFVLFVVLISFFLLKKSFCDGFLTDKIKGTFVLSVSILIIKNWFSGILWMRSYGGGGRRKNERKKIVIRNHLVRFSKTIVLFTKLHQAEAPFTVPVLFSARACAWAACMACVISSISREDLPAAYYLVILQDRLQCDHHCACAQMLCHFSYFPRAFKQKN